MKAEPAETLVKTEHAGTATRLDEPAGVPEVLVAKGNDGNYLQHSIEVAIAVRLAAMDHPCGRLHVSLAHGMAPFEPCNEPRSGQTRGLLEGALDLSSQPAQENEPPIVAAYRATCATFRRYPNSAELLRRVVGEDKLSGGITEVDAEKYEQLANAWAGLQILPAHSSWRSQIRPNGVLACPVALQKPWLFTLDPTTYREDGDSDDDYVYRADLDRLSGVLKPFAQSDKPGVAAIFVYAVKPEVRSLFWRFVDGLASHTGANVISYWLPHQGGNRNLAALLCSRFKFSSEFVPPGIRPGRD